MLEKEEVENMLLAKRDLLDGDFPSDVGGVDETEYLNATPQGALIAAPARCQGAQSHSSGNQHFEPEIGPSGFSRC
jgi:hypothetical protein